MRASVHACVRAFPCGNVLACAACHARRTHLASREAAPEASGLVSFCSFSNGPIHAIHPPARERASSSIHVADEFIAPRARSFQVTLYFAGAPPSGGVQIRRVDENNSNALPLYRAAGSPVCV